MENSLGQKKSKTKFRRPCRYLRYDNETVFTNEYHCAFNNCTVKIAENCLSCGNYKSI